jgi:hypothetical protein
MHECHGRAHSAYILPDAKLCHAADFFGNDVLMVTSLPLFEPSIFERALSFKRFLKRFGTSGRV